MAEKIHLTQPDGSPWTREAVERASVDAGGQLQVATSIEAALRPEAATEVVTEMIATLLHVADFLLEAPLEDLVEGLGKRRDQETDLGTRAQIHYLQELARALIGAREHLPTALTNRPLPVLGLDKPPHYIARGICRVCHCTEAHACERGCRWIEPDLCSRCYELGLS